MRRRFRFAQFAILFTLMLTAHAQDNSGVLIQPSQRRLATDMVASWYGGDDDGFAGRQTASGEVFNPEEMTCAHKTLPLGSYIEVTNELNGETVTLRVNDRGPYVKGRDLDLSRAAAAKLGVLKKGVANLIVLEQSA